MFSLWQLLPGLSGQDHRPRTEIPPARRQRCREGLLDAGHGPGVLALHSTVNKTENDFQS